MTVHLRQIGTVTIVDMQGRITVQEGADVPYIDSTGLGELVRIHLSVSRRGGRLALLQLPSKIRELLSVTRLLPVFDAFDDENAAVDSCREVRGSVAEPS